MDNSKAGKTNGDELRHSTSSSPPTHLPRIGVPIVEEGTGGVVSSASSNGNRGVESLSSTSCSSTTIYSSTPPSSLLHMSNNNPSHYTYYNTANNGNSYRHVNIKQRSIMADDLSNSSSLSASPSTPRKEWETRFKSYQMQRSEKLDDTSSSTAGDDYLSASANNIHNKYDVPDISTMASSSLPHNYILENRNRSLPARKATTFHGGNIGSKFVNSNKLPKKSSQEQTKRNDQSASFSAIQLTKSLDDSQKAIGADASTLISSSLTSSPPLKLQTVNSLIQCQEQRQNEQGQNTSKANHPDTSTRGGNFFAFLHPKKKNKDDNDSSSSSVKKKEKKKTSKLLRLKTPKQLSEPKRRTKSYGCLLDTSMRGGSGGDSAADATRNISDKQVRSTSDSLFRHKIHSSNITNLHNKYGPSGVVIGPEKVARSRRRKMDSKKEKKLIFTDLRNDFMTKDSATAFLGEEKSTHKGKHFGKQFSKPIDEDNENHNEKKETLAEKHLTPVKEESSEPTEFTTILNPIQGVESWTEESKNLILPAVIAMCRPIVFEKFHSNVANSEDDSSKIRFGCIIFGSAHVAKQDTEVGGTKDEGLTWKPAHFELRQNYLLEYGNDADVTKGPRGYAFLQGATVQRHQQFANTLCLEFKQHQSTRIRCTVLIRLKSTIEEERWLWCLSQAIKLKIEDLFQYDSSELGKELGRGRYASIRPGRRRGKYRSNSSHHQSFSVSGGASEDGILKKKPSFSSFSNLSILSQEDYECALKIVDKKLFWKNVKQGNERADSLVRETCVQAAIITQASSKEHKGFLQLKSFFETEEKVVLELELLEGTDLYQYMKKKQPLSEFEASQIMCDILNCIVAMKNLGIAHRDLKPANILMANKSNRHGTRVNVGDFGHATFVGENNLVRGRCGTVGYVAPEIFLAGKNSGYANKVDEFSAGVILYVLLCGYEPFYGETEKELIEVNKRAIVEFPEEDWLSISLEGRDLVEKLMTKDPSKRINARKALEHPWLTRRALRMRQTTPQENQTDQSTDVTDFACTIS